MVSNDAAPGLFGVRTAEAAQADSSPVRDLTWSALHNSLLAYDPSDAQFDNVDPEQIPDTPLLHIANRVLLVDDDPAVEQSYLHAARQWYAATTEHATRDRAKATLDAWEKRHTGGLIKSSGIEITDGTTVTAQFMDEEFLLAYALGTGWQAIRLPYRERDNDAQLVMDVILPDEGTTPTDLPEGTWQQASAQLDAIHGRRR
ncbi:hypothetical protein [Actinomyces sp.]|uniref:hypothetical protein n=1 Tax=Actinomyces sp. TaxID=29317 RepID=UPI0026DCA739|nr:hypothetical protein [Actinomyces sp.]MDO4900133.1 hypothetical protein [Actinomyces sp.]